MRKNEKYFSFPMLALRNKLKGLNFIRFLQPKQESSKILNASLRQLTFSEEN